MLQMCSGGKAICHHPNDVLFLCCRPSSQPYVMASGVTKSGTSNGYPMKAQLQIIGKSSVLIKVDRGSSKNIRFTSFISVHFFSKTFCQVTLVKAQV